MNGGRAIFVNYRREDSGGQARALLYALEQAFPDQVFMDVKGLAPGVNYLEEIEHSVGSCKVVIVLIGRAWASVTDSAGRRRLKDPRDVVALEIGTALRRPDVLVIPVLVGGATLPPEEDLPVTLHGLLGRQCLQLTEQDWDYNVTQLVETLRKKVGGAGARSRARLKVGLAVAVVLALAGVGVWAAAMRSKSGSPAAGIQAAAQPATPPAVPPAKAAQADLPAKAAPPAAPVAAPVVASPVPPPAASAPPASKKEPPAKPVAAKPTPAKPNPAKAPPAKAAAPAGAVASAEPAKTEAPLPKVAESRIAFATSDVVAFNQYLGSPEARGRGRSLVGNAKWFLGPRDSFTFAPEDQAPGFFPMTVRATRDGDRVSFEGMRSARASDGQAYVRISGHLVLGKMPVPLTIDLEFGRVASGDSADLQPTFKSQARLQLRAE